MPPKKVTIIEVSPRDGLEGIKKDIPLEFKIELIERCFQAGLTTIEVGAFFSNDDMPALKNTADVLQKFSSSNAIRLISLVNGENGLRDAFNAGAKEITVFTAATDSYTKDIAKCTVEERLNDLKKIITSAQKNHIRVRGAISVALGCPLEGDVNSKKVALIAKQLFEMGCDEIILGDSAGLGNPRKVENLIHACITEEIPINKVALHCHNTYGMALVNIYAGLQMGVSIIESAVGGLGGRFNTPGAGNIATEDLIYMLNGLGIETNINLDLLIQTGRFACEYLNRPLGSKISSI